MICMWLRIVVYSLNVLFLFAVIHSYWYKDFDSLHEDLYHYQYRHHQVALVVDVSRICLAVALAEYNKDYHFVRTASPQDPMKDFHMNQVTVGISLWQTNVSNTMH